jgi:hypothetical protein
MRHHLHTAIDYHTHNIIGYWLCRLYERHMARSYRLRPTR